MYKKEAVWAVLLKMLAVGERGKQSNKTNSIVVVFKDRFVFL